MKRFLAILVMLVAVNTAFGQIDTLGTGGDGVIVNDTTWTNDEIIFLDGFIAVANNATLTIEPGTIIMGSKINKGTLIITQGAKIDAQGTACEPIVFTSAQAVGSKATGDWGGVIILGNAPIFTAGGTDLIEGGLPATIDGVTGISTYGGTNAADNSGILSYVRIEYCGIAFTLDNEINGLTMGGVGSGTQIDHIQVSYAGDDSYEWFGGTVNGKYLITLAGLDDDWDGDQGWRGNVQYAVALRDPLVADAAGTSNGWEQDGDNAGVLTPETRGRFANVTQIGPRRTPATTVSTFYGRGAELREKTNSSIFNSIVMGYPKAGLRLEDGAGENFCDGDLQLENNLIAGMPAGLEYVCNDELCTYASCSAGDVVSTLNASSNTVFPDVAAGGNFFIQLTDPYGANPDFRPAATSPALTSSTFDVTTLDPFFEATSYVGAFDGTNDWTASWAEFDPQNVDYFALGSINYNPVLAATVSGGGCDDGAIDLTVSGDFRGTVSYDWSNGATSQDVSGLAPDTYTVTASANGCEAMLSETTSLEAPTTIGTNVTATQAQLSWNPVSGSVGCQLQGRPVGAPSFSTRTVGGFEPTGAIFPLSALPGGTSFEWAVRCACSIPPLPEDVTPLSSPLEMFNTPAGRFGADNGFTIFPNPASDIVYITMTAEQAEDMVIRVMDMSGRTVIEQIASITVGQQNIEVNVEDLETGTYFVEVGDKATKQLIIE